MSQASKTVLTQCGMGSGQKHPTGSSMAKSQWELFPKVAFGPGAQQELQLVLTKAGGFKQQDPYSHSTA